MQQRAMVSLNGATHTAYVPAKILGDKTAETMLDAMGSALPELAPARLQPLAKSVFDRGFCSHMSDFVSSNRLTHALAAYNMPDMCLDEGRCAMHQAHLVFVHASKPFGLTSPLFSLHQGLQNANNKVKFVASLSKSAKTVRIIQGRRPPPEAQAYRDWLFESTLGRFQYADDMDEE